MKLRRILTVLCTALIMTGCANAVSSVTYDSTISATINTLPLYWNAKMKYAGKAFNPPPVYSYTKSSDISCDGSPAKLNNARYCSVGNIVSFDDNFTREGYAKFGSGFVYYLFGHEYAHAVQFQVDEQLPNDRAYELQADCMAGAYISEMHKLGYLPLMPTDLLNIRTIVYSVGDDSDSPGTPSKPDGHGTGNERYTQFYAGYTSGLSVCHVKDVG